MGSPAWRITRLDVLTGMDELKLCTAYRLPDGSITEDYPVDTQIMAQAEAIYETMPGWGEPISATRQFDGIAGPSAGLLPAHLSTAECAHRYDLCGCGAKRPDRAALAHLK